MSCLDVVPKKEIATVVATSITGSDLLWFAHAILGRFVYIGILLIWCVLVTSQSSHINTCMHPSQQR